MSGAEKVFRAVRAAGARLEMEESEIIYVGAGLTDDLQRDIQKNADEIAFLLLGKFKSAAHLVGALTGSGRWISLEGPTLRVHGHAGVPHLPAWLEIAVADSRFELAALLRKSAGEYTPLEREGLELAEACGAAWIEAQGNGFRGG